MSGLNTIENNALEVGSHKLIYVFEIQRSEQHEGRIKVGEASIKLPQNFTNFDTISQIDLEKAARTRIDQYTKTSDTEYTLLHVEIAVRKEKDKETKEYTNRFEGFRDYDIHRVLQNSGYNKDLRREDKNNGEWFNANVQTVIAAIKAYKNHKHFIGVEDLPKIELFPEQKDAVIGSLKAFENATIKNPKRVLWNAKMRFGKTLTSYSLMDELKNTQKDFSKVLILTHFPAVRDGWKEDYQKSLIASGWAFGDKEMKVDFNEIASNEKFVWFASIQDIRGSDKETDIDKINFENAYKNSELFTTEWDLIITDEVHMGTLTDLAVKMFSSLKSARYLDLSGTPFNVVNFDEMDGEERQERFDYDYQYNWSYVDEQEAKKRWAEEHPLEPNPYANRPEIKYITYDITDVVSELDPVSALKASYSLTELFKISDTDNKTFLHEDAVKNILNKIRGEKRFNKTNAHLFPFSGEHGVNFPHTFWLLPNVPSVRAMQALLEKQGSGFEGYKIINATGEGLASPEVEENKALQAVKNAIKNNEKTITLSQQMLTTGVTIPEWNAVLMFNNTSSPMTYNQAAFRAASSGSLPDGRIKETAYIFDFNPDRCLKILVETARKNIKDDSSNNDPDKESEEGEATQDERLAIERYLNSTPVLSFDGAKFVERDSFEIMRKINEVFIDEAYEKGFNSRRIFDRKALANFDFNAVRVLEALRASQGNKKKNDAVDVTKVDDKTKEELDEYNKRIAKGKKLSKEEKARKESIEKDQVKDKKNRDNATKILVSIVTRVPMLVFAADLSKDEIQIETFNQLIDDESWNEFMDKNILRVKPEGEPGLVERLDLIEKGIPQKLYWEDIYQFFNKTIFEGACHKVRELTDEANQVDDPILRALYKIQIFGTFRNPDKETVLTPSRVVQLQLNNTLGGIELFDLEKSDTTNFYIFVKDSNDNKLSVHIDQAVDKLKEGSYILDYTFKNVDEEESNLKDFWSQKDFSIYDPNSKSALYPLFGAMSRFLALKNKESILTDNELWDRIIDREIYLNTRVKYSALIAKRMLTRNNGEVNATTIDIVRLLNSFKAYNSLKKADRPEDYKKIDNIHEGVGVILRLAQHNFMKLYADKAIYDLTADGSLKFQEVIGMIESGNYGLEDMMEVQKLIEVFKDELPKFEVVVSNPPYQDEDSGAGSASMPIYQHFQDVSLLIANITSMIYKDNWTTAMNDDRNGLHDWRKSLIESQRLVDVLFMGDIFPGTSVSVTIVLCKLQGSNIFNKYNPNIPITKTVDQILTKTQSIVNVQSRVLTYGKNSLGYTQKEIRAAKIENKASGKIKFIDLDNREPFFADLNLTLIGEIALKSNWKVGYHATRPWKQHTEDRIFHIKSQELPAEKILMLNFDSEEEFENYKAYVKTKLWGYLAMKSTNDISGPVGHLSFIPWLDYTNNNPLFKSDEELSEDHEYYGLTLDQRLYKYFNLTDEEISIIEDSF